MANSDPLKSKIKVSHSGLFYKFESLHSSIQKEYVEKFRTNKSWRTLSSHIPNTSYLLWFFFHQSSVGHFWQLVTMQPVTTLINVSIASKAMTKTISWCFRFNLWQPPYQIQPVKCINQRGKCVHVFRSRTMWWLCFTCLTQHHIIGPGGSGIREKEAGFRIGGKHRVDVSSW